MRQYQRQQASRQPWKISSVKEEIGEKCSCRVEKEHFLGSHFYDLSMHLFVRLCICKIQLQK